MAEAQQLAQQLSASVQSVFAGLGNYLALITRNNPYGTSRQLFARPDVAAEIGSALEEARDSALQAVQDAWYGQDGPRGHQVLDHLLNDVERAYSLRLLRNMVRLAYLSVPTGQFIPGVTAPGANPAMESAQQRAQTVQDAVAAFARRALHRNALSIDIAAGHARTEAQIAEARASGEELLKRWRAHVDSPVCCHWCRNLDGVTIPLHESFVYHIGPAVDLTGHGHLTHPPRPYKNRLPGPKLHPNCLIAGSAVAAEGVIGATARVYHGEVVSFRTLSDKLLSATPNHPVLTDQGWVAAGLLQEGDHVVSAAGIEWPAFGDYQDDGMPALIEQVAETFLGSGEVTSAEVPVTAEDFHGDGAGSEVCVVGANRRLTTELDPAPGKQVRNFQFEGTDARGLSWLVAGLNRLRHLAAAVPGLCAASYRRMRSGSELLTFLRAGLGHSQGISLAAPPWLDACVEQAVADDPSGNAERLRQGMLGLPGGVALDKIIYVERNVVTTHVYNLETRSGWYIGSGIVVHNCRCWLEIVPAAAPGPVPSEGGQAAVIPATSYLAASEIRAMPEEKYSSLLAFLRAATHELGHLLRRLVRRE